MVQWRKVDPTGARTLGSNANAISYKLCVYWNFLRPGSLMYTPIMVSTTLSIQKVFQFVDIVDVFHLNLFPRKRYILKLIS